MVDLGSLEPTETIAVQGLVYTYRQCLDQAHANIKACQRARKKAAQALKDHDPINAESLRQVADACERDANVWKHRAEKLQGG